jgi:hypothetical protein
MLIASLIAHAGMEVARGLKSAGSGAGAEGGAAFQSLKGAIASGNPTAAKSALADMRKALTSAGSINAANFVENRLSSIGGALK